MQTMLRLAYQTMEAIDTPRALTVAILLRYEEWDQIAALGIDPLLYLDFEQEKYLLDAQATALLRKNPDLKTSFDRPKAAKESFFRSELDNARTNARFSGILEGFHPEGWSAWVYDFHVSAAKVVRSVLGVLPDDLTPRFGPGATFDDRGQLITVPDKMTSIPTSTADARCLMPLLEGTAWARANAVVGRPLDPTTVRGGRFTTVPKNGETDRGIDIQPSINSAYQLAVGRIMKDRLKAWGLNLQDGQTIHQRTAEIASLTGGFATIDLKDASNRNARLPILGLLMFSLPWKAVLETLRTRSILIDGKWHHLEMFSAMGNGFTFELETLVFASIAYTVMDRMGLSPQPGVNLFVYGDDIIVPTGAAQSVIAALEFYGHRPNPKKTFITGSFRESCGGDFMKGQSVRPFFLDETPSAPHNFISFANGLLRTHDQLPSWSKARKRLMRVHYSILGEIPTMVRCLRGPRVFGDSVIHDDRRHTWQKREVHGASRNFIRIWTPEGIHLPWKHWRRDIQFASALYGVDSSGPSPRGELASFRKRWAALLE